MASDIYPSRVSGEARLLPRQDPVIYSDWTSSAPLSREQVEFYAQNGFLVLNDVFSANEVARLQEEANRLRTEYHGLEPETTIIEPGAGAVRSIFKIHTQSDLFQRLMADARLARVAEFLLGDNVYIHQSRLNYKPGFEGKEFYWHSDFETWHAEDGMPRMRALSMSVLLTDNTPENGPTMFIPGSHQCFISCVGETPEDHYKKSLKKQEFGVPDRRILGEIANKRGVVAPVGVAGTVVIFDCNTMHGSNSNITPFPRSNAFFVYNAMSNQLTAPFGADKPRPEFIGARENIRKIEPIDGELVKVAA